MSKHKRIIYLKVLPGQPVDGTGQLCIHFFVRDEHGPFIEPHVLHPKLDDQGQPIKGELTARPTRGRIACDSKRSVVPITKNNVTVVTMRTDSPQAVTCPKCKMTKDYMDLMAKGN